MHFTVDFRHRVRDADFFQYKYSYGQQPLQVNAVLKTKVQPIGSLQVTNLMGSATTSKELLENNMVAWISNQKINGRVSHRRIP